MLSATRLIGHKEYAKGRKFDPRYDMNWRRARVAGFRPRTGAVTEEDDMPTPKDVVDALLSAPLEQGVGNVRHALEDTRVIARRTERAVLALAAIRPDVDEAELARQLAPLVTPTLVEALGEDLGLTREQVEAALKRLLTT